MKRSVLTILALVACLHCAVTKKVTSYLTTDLFSWGDLMQAVMKTGRPETPQFSADQCARSKSYNTYLLSGVSRNFLFITEKFDELLEYDGERLKIFESDESVVKHHLKNPLAELLVSFNDLKNLMKPIGDISISELCFLATERLKEKIDNLNMKQIRDQMFAFPKEFTMLSDIVLFLQNYTPTVCGIGFSARDALYSLYSRIITAEAQLYIADLFSNYFVYRYNGMQARCYYSNQTSLESEIFSLHYDFQVNMRHYATVFIAAMEEVHDQFRECDAKTMERDVTFFELEGALQIVGMPPAYAGPTCADIDSVGVNREHYCKPYPKYECILVPRPCLGRISSCYTYYKDAGVCIAEESNPRRYLWINYPGGPQRDPEKCESHNYFDLKWTAFWECFCTCEDNDPNSKSTHIINLQAVEADVKSNMVLTGLRFVVRYGILQFQIQQGILIDNWRVVNATWKPIDDISSRVYAKRAGRNFRGQPPNVLENKDYYIVKKGSRLDMADLKVPENYIITGIRFQHVESESLRIAIISRPFMPSTAKIIIATMEEAKLTFAAEKSSERLTLNPHQPLVASTEMHEISRSHHHYVQFETSDWFTDSGQTTIPIFDATPILSNPSSPLGGIGIFYKTAPSAAGVISLKLFSFDYTSYMQKSLEETLKT